MGLLVNKARLGTKDSPPPSCQVPSPWKRYLPIPVSPLHTLFSSPQDALDPSALSLSTPGSNGVPDPHTSSREPSPLYHQALALHGQHRAGP